jgi:hypothetical protein
VNLYQPGDITLTLYTTLGEEVYRTMVHGNVGENDIVWSLRNKAESAVSSGLYLCAIQVVGSNGTSTQITKVVVFH